MPEFPGTTADAASFQPRNPQYRDMVTQSFNAQKVMAELQVSLKSVAPGAVELTFPFSSRWTQQHGFIHAGIITTVLDSACGYAALSLMPADAGVLSIEFKIQLMSPARGDHFKALGRVDKPGRNITFVSGDLFACSGDGPFKRVAAMTGTMMTVLDRPDVRH